MQLRETVASESGRERHNQETGRNDKTDHADGIIRRLVGMIILTMLMMMMLVVVLVLIMMMMMMMMA